MPNDDLTRAGGDWVAGVLDADGVRALADAVEADPHLRRELAGQVALDRILRQSRAPAIDAERVMRALPLAVAGGSMQQRVLRQISSRARQARVPRRWLAATAAIAAVVALAVGLGLLMPDDRPDLVGAPAPATVERAQVRAAPGARWADGRAPASAAVDGGRLDLRAGLAEVELPSGARLVVEGPSVLEITGANRARLLVGRVSAYVPPPAHGFTLAAEGLEVMDLGTAFGLAQGEGGQAELQVFHGAVEATTRMGGGNARRSLRAGEAVVVDPRGRAVTAVAYDPSRFARSLQPSDLVLDLADLVAGGDGRGSGVADGINPATGALQSGPSLGVVRGADYRRVPEAPAIDGVFIPDGSAGRTRVSSTGLDFAFPPTDGAGYDLIRRGGTLDYPWNGGTRERPGIPPVFGGVDYHAYGHSALGLHANAGFTIDLAALNARHPGLRAARFSAHVANVGRKGGIGTAWFWVLIDGQVVQQHPHLTPDSAVVAIDLWLAPGRRFLTLASTDYDGTSGLDWITLGDPRLHLAATPE